MAVRLRLRREGTKKTPHYRVVAADKRSPRDGKFIEIIGEYHPLDDPSTIEIDHERALHWLRHGAQPSSQVEKLLRIVGVWEEFKPGDEPERDRSDEAGKPKLSKKAKAKKKAEAEAATEAADQPAPETPETPEEPAAETPEEPSAEADEEPSAEADEESADDTDAAADADADADADAEEDES